MNKENELLQTVNKSVKNANTKTQPPITEPIKEKKRQKKQERRCRGIISNNEGVIKALITSTYWTQKNKISKHAKIRWHAT